MLRRPIGPDQPSVVLRKVQLTGQTVQPNPHPAHRAVEQVEGRGVVVKLSHEPAESTSGSGGGGGHLQAK